MKNRGMEKALGDHRVTYGPCGCEVHQRQRRKSTRTSTNAMTDLQRRLVAGKAGLLELALLRETQRRLVEEAIRQKGLGSSNEDQRSNSSNHLRAQSSVSDSNDGNRSWSAGEESDEVFEISNATDERSRVDRSNARDSPTDRTRLRCMSELQCRSTRIISDASSSSPVRNDSGRRRRHRHRCRSEGTGRDSSDADRAVHLSAAYMNPLVFSGLTYDFPSPLHAVLTQFDLTTISPAFAATSGASGNVSATFLGTLKMAFDEPESPRRLQSGQESNSVDEKTDSTTDECVVTRPRQSQVVISESDEQVFELEGNFRENLNISARIKADEQSEDIEPHNRSLIGKMAASEEFLGAEISRTSCHRLNSEPEDSDNNDKRLHSDDRTVGTTAEEDSPQKTSLSGLLREEGYFSSNDSLASSVAPEPPSRKRRRGGGGGGGGGGMNATRPFCSEASFSDSLASDSCEDSSTPPRDIERGDRDAKTRTRLLSDFDADDRTPIFC